MTKTSVSTPSIKRSTNLTFNFTHKTLDFSTMETESKQDQTEDPLHDPLLTNPNPNQASVTESPESTVSFDSSSDPNPKKTRELPNLSDCHSCGVRINHTNPRDRLQPLDSMWRIVLLCKKCTKRVSNSDLCSYCFSSVVDELDCVKCSDCDRSVHKECVARYGPGLGLGFTVCVDCWIPEAIAKSIRARKRRIRKMNKELCEGRVCVREMKRKVVVGLKARDVVVKKAMVSKSAVELGKGVLSVVDCRNVAVGGANGEVKAVDDVELAILLHRAINSSPRISRCTRLVGSVQTDDVPIACYSRRRDGKKIVLRDSSSLDVPLICYTRRYRMGCLKSSASLDAPLMCYTRRRSGCKACSHDIECECYICKASNHGSTSSEGLKACNSVSTSDNSLSDSCCQENDIGRKPLRYLLKYYRVGKGKPRPSVFAEDPGCSCMDLANLYPEGMPDTRSYGNGNECLEILENCDDKTDRFLLKYKRSLRYEANI
ncbi:putative chromatin regulator PHD family [Helianthus anomalus]